jgi:hypothetical protein
MPAAGRLAAAILSLSQTLKAIGCQYAEYIYQVALHGSIKRLSNEGVKGGNETNGDGFRLMTDETWLPGTGFTFRVQTFSCGIGVWKSA